MPTYDYLCGVCGHRVEVVHGVHAHGPRVCPDCGADGSMRKLLSAPTIVFKGSGWAKKDRAATAARGRTQTDKASEPAGGDKASEPAGGDKASEPASGDKAAADKKPAESRAATAEASSTGSTGD